MPFKQILCQQFILNILLTTITIINASNQQLPLKLVQNENLQYKQADITKQEERKLQDGINVCKTQCIDENQKYCTFISNLNGQGECCGQQYSQYFQNQFISCNQLNAINIFDALDSNQNGYVSWPEVSSRLLVLGGAQVIGQQIFNQVDSNKDNQVSKDELGRYFFQFFDQNKDGVLSLEEYQLSIFFIAQYSNKILVPQWDSNSINVYQSLNLQLYNYQNIKSSQLDSFLSFNQYMVESQDVEKFKNVLICNNLNIFKIFQQLSTQNTLSLQNVMENTLQQDVQITQSIFYQIDQNSDGMVSLDEVAIYIYNQIDFNKNNEVTYSEVIQTVQYISTYFQMNLKPKWASKLQSAYLSMQNSLQTPISLQNFQNGISQYGYQDLDQIFESSQLNTSISSSIDVCASNDRICSDYSYEMPSFMKYQMCPNDQNNCGVKVIQIERNDSNQILNVGSSYNQLFGENLCSFIVYLPQDSKEGDSFDLIINKLNNVDIWISQQNQNFNSKGLRILQEYLVNYLIAGTYKNYQNSSFSIKKIQGGGQTLSGNIQSGRQIFLTIQPNSKSQIGNFDIKISANFPLTQQKKSNQNENEDNKIGLIWIILGIISVIILLIFIVCLLYRYIQIRKARMKEQIKIQTYSMKSTQERKEGQQNGISEELSNKKIFQASENISNDQIQMPEIIKAHNYEARNNQEFSNINDKYRYVYQSNQIEELPLPESNQIQKISFQKKNDYLND